MSVTQQCGCRWSCHCIPVIHEPARVVTTPKQHSVNVPYIQGGNTFVSIKSDDIRGSLYIPTPVTLNRVWTVWLRDVLTRLLDEDSNVVPPR
jgi:hypothetical protein